MWFQSRSLARKSASADVRVFSEVDELRSLDARCDDSRPGIAMAAMIAMIAITIISSIRVKPFRERPKPLRIDQSSTFRSRTCQILPCEFTHYQWTYKNFLIYLSRRWAAGPRAP